ncbi:hypothetical protein [Flavobacterium sp. UBA7682]|uniref:hypothetical protein n=1 Tax=Flavobacterium sp. UBA7682 TaxID=1946560 RepID=UPI0025C4C810|nr:hypothetical protein [Flavobacterium sp. UBA7682]
MKTNKTTLKPSMVISMSPKTKERINAVANNLKGKELFTDKIELAKKTLSELKSLPI